MQESVHQPEREGIYYIPCPRYEGYFLANAPSKEQALKISKQAVMAYSGLAVGLSIAEPKHAFFPEFLADEYDRPMSEKVRRDGIWRARVTLAESNDPIINVVLDRDLRPCGFLCNTANAWYPYFEGRHFLVSLGGELLGQTCRG